jgi:penicillin-binding protein 2
VVSNKNNMRLDPHSLPLHLRHQSLFIAFAPADDPRIAVAVVVEHGGFGASSAAPIARAIMDAWLLPKKSVAAIPLATPGAASAVPGVGAASGTASAPAATPPGAASARPLQHAPESQQTPETQQVPVPDDAEVD